MRTFETGATREANEDKLKYEGCLSPIVLRRFAQYMLKHELQSDGQRRKADNWQAGIPLDAYMDSLLRHTIELWLAHRGWGPVPDKAETLCAIFFNTQGYLHELLKADSALPPRLQEINPTLTSVVCPICKRLGEIKDILYHGKCWECVENSR